MRSIDMLERWMMEAGIDPMLQECLVEYCKGRGGVSMDTISRGLGHCYRQMAMD